MSNSLVQKFSKEIATIVLGVIIPLALMFQAYSVLQKLNLRIQEKKDSPTLAATFTEFKKNLTYGNDYLLITKLHAEQVNLEVMTNKQVMKIAIINIGFAVMSVGIMFLLLGISETGNSQPSIRDVALKSEPVAEKPSSKDTINSGDLTVKENASSKSPTSEPNETENKNSKPTQPEANAMQIAGEAKGVKFDIKTGSTGIAVFLLGALMATGGGLIPNEYHTGNIPGYFSHDPLQNQNLAKQGSNSLSEREQQMIKNFNICKSNFSDSHELAYCFTNKYLNEYSEVKQNEKK